ncbi:MAG: guanylate kinase [Chloroflexi bacterium]|nr:guanylate kinase [Chloroflexota bacterium]
MGKASGAEPLIIVLTGPSGVGKDAVVNRARELGVPLERPATMTTRAPRPGEVEGVHHLFVTPEQFTAHVAAGELLEHAEVYGKDYGVPRSSVRQAQATGNHVVIRVDVQGAETLHGILPDALFISLEPSELDALRRHLEERATESNGEAERRLAIARDEIDRAGAFCRRLVNVEGDLDATVRALVAMIEAEQSRTDRAPVVV